MALILASSAWAEARQETVATPPNAALAANPGRLETELDVDATVLTIRRAELREVGILSSIPSMSPRGSSFAANATEEMGRTLSRRGEVLHNVRFRVPSGKVTQIRIGSSTPVNGQNQLEHEYLDAGIEIEFAHRVSANRQSLPVTLAARLLIRSGNSTGGLARTVFTTHPIQYEARVPDGSNIILGGFIDDMDAKLIGGMNGAGSNTLLRQVLSDEQRQNETEIVVILALPRNEVPGSLPTSSAGAETTPLLQASATQAPPPTPPVDTAPPMPPTPALTPKGTAGPTLYTVQVGAFGNRGAAQALMRDLSARYSELSIQVIPGDKTLYRVRVGRFTDREAAGRVLNQLRGDGFTPFVTLLD
jgi:cell division septation protein DedD